jgi:hypothetical protein
MEFAESEGIAFEDSEDFPESTDDEPDLPPEYCHYRDIGCDLADSCLNCPLLKCVYDEPGGKQHYIKGLRNREILRLFTAEGKEIGELAAIFGISQRTVHRALKREENE